MPLAPGTVIYVARGGDGATADGRYVPGTAPGDIVQEDGSISRGPMHADPPCRHFGTCGGCQLQHLTDEAYAGFLRNTISRALAQQGVPDVALADPHISPPRSRRRTSLKARRQGGNIRIGFSERASHRVVDLAECHVLRAELFALVAPLRTLLAGLNFLESGGSVTMTLADQGIDVAVSGVEADSLEAVATLNDFAAHHRLARLTVDDGFGPQSRWEPEAVTITLGGVCVPLPPNAFLQATQDGEAVLVGAVRRAVGEASTVADLFAGLGTFALSQPGRAYAAEGSRDAALALKAAAAAAGRAVAVEHRDLFRRPVPTVDLDRFDAVILDPPRAGAKEQVAQLARSKVPRLAYVSCNPATFARDAAMLASGGYVLKDIQPVGQFRWSTHVELAASFEKR